MDGRAAVRFVSTNPDDSGVWGVTTGECVTVVGSSVWIIVMFTTPDEFQGAETFFDHAIEGTGSQSRTDCGSS